MNPTTDQLIETLFQPQVRNEVKGLVTELGLAGTNIRARLQSGAAVWIDLLTMARHLVALIPIPTLYATAITAVLDWVIKFLQSTAPTAIAA